MSLVEWPHCSGHPLAFGPALRPATEQPHTPPALGVPVREPAAGLCWMRHLKPLLRKQKQLQWRDQLTWGSEKGANRILYLRFCPSADLSSSSKIQESVTWWSLSLKGQRSRRNWPFWNPRGKKRSCHSPSFCKGRANSCFPHTASFCLHASIAWWRCIYWSFAHRVAENSPLCFLISCTVYLPWRKQIECHSLLTVWTGVKLKQQHSFGQPPAWPRTLPAAALFESSVPARQANSTISEELSN